MIPASTGRRQTSANCEQELAAGATLLNHPVLLAGMNDPALARGHMTELARTLPGYLVPRRVREMPNQGAKTVISAGPDPA